MYDAGSTASIVIKNKQIWTDKPEYKRVELQKMIERSRKIICSANFERDQRNFFKRLKESSEHKRKILKMIKFLKC